MNSTNETKADPLIENHSKRIVRMDTSDPPKKQPKRAKTDDGDAPVSDNNDYLSDIDETVDTHN